mgnify:CR=1 FL=1
MVYAMRSGGNFASSALYQKKNHVLQLLSDGLAGRLRCKQRRPKPIELKATITRQNSIRCILGKAYVVLLASGASMSAPAALAQST